MACDVCSVGEDKYRCPKCGRASCSLECYRRHGQGGCAAEFDAEEQAARMQNVRVADVDQKRRVEEALRQFWEGEEGGEDWEREAVLAEEIDALEHASELLDVGDVDGALSAMTLEQRERWSRGLADGTLGLQAWEPWWEVDGSDARFCKDLLVEESVRQAARRASPLIANSVVEMLCVFSFVLRLYNGDLEEEDAAEEIVSRSSVLSKDMRYPDVPSAVRQAYHNVGSIQAIVDAAAIFRRECGPFRALNELCRLLSARKHKQSVNYRLLRRKVSFLCAWVNLCSHTSLLGIASLVAQEADAIASITTSKPPEKRTAKITELSATELPASKRVATRLVDID